MLDGYKKMLGYIFILLVAIGAFIMLIGTNPLIQNSISVAVLALGGGYLWYQGAIDKKKILATPRALRGAVDATPLDKYTQILILILSTASSLIVYFVQDPAKAATYTQFLSQIIQPIAIMILGLFFSKITAGITVAKITVTPEPATVPTDKPSVPSVIAPVNPNLDPVILYQYADVNEVAKKIKAMYPETDALSPAYAFYRETQGYDLNRVQPDDRVKQAKEFVYMSQKLFNDGFKTYTKLEPPTLAELTNRPALLVKIKRDYEKANNLTCSGKTFEEINVLLGMMDDFVNFDKGFKLLGNQVSGLKWDNLRVGYNPFDVALYAGSLIDVLKMKAIKKK